jgi:hypothetical protein
VSLRWKKVRLRRDLHKRGATTSRAPASRNVLAGNWCHRTSSTSQQQKMLGQQ